MARKASASCQSGCASTATRSPSASSTRLMTEMCIRDRLKPVNARLDALQATVDAVAEAEGIAPDKAHKSKKHSR